MIAICFGWLWDIEQESSFFPSLDDGDICSGWNDVEDGCDCDRCQVQIQGILIFFCTSWGLTLPWCDTYGASSTGHATGGGLTRGRYHRRRNEFRVVTRSPVALVEIWPDTRALPLILAILTYLASVMKSEFQYRRKAPGSSTAGEVLD